MYAVLSDIHGNLQALEKVVEDMKQFDIRGIFLLGDLIDYGMQSNEVVAYIRNHLEGKICCNIWGNHERAILTPNYEGFSSERGVLCAQHTDSLLTQDTRNYLTEKLCHEGQEEVFLQEKRILAIHGSKEDPYWKAIAPDEVRGDYSAYDLVLSGHSHYSHMFTKFYQAQDPMHRNRHRVVFLNPGSVGQPRNHNPAAQYALVDFDTMAVQLRAIPYDVKAAMALYDGSVDDFYRMRIEMGI
jgi:predicted phosphodiesterase